MSISPLAIHFTEILVRPFEGLHRIGRDGLVYPYLCPGGYWTQGWGLRVPKTAPPITVAEADRRLAAALPKYVQDALRLCPRLHLYHPAVQGAIADFTFNLGAANLSRSTLRRRINEGNWPAAYSELERWVLSDGKRLPGLVARRAAEIKQIKDHL